MTDHARLTDEVETTHPTTLHALQVIEHAVGETNVAMTVEGRQRFPVRVRSED